MRTKSLALLCLLSAAVLVAGACTSKPKGTVNTPPTAVVLAAPTSGALPLPVDFSGTLSSDAGGSIVSYDWDLGDGNTETQAEFSHSYSVEDAYTVTLTVTDNKGATGTDTVDITVGPMAEPNLGCNDSTGALSLIYNGPIDSYKNAQLANNTTGCGSDPINNHLSVVSALDIAGATAACQAGADPAVSGVINLVAAGFTTLPVTAWTCLNGVGAPELLLDGACYPLNNNALAVQFAGPRNTLNNASVHSPVDCSDTVAPAFTYVQHSTQAAALALCTSLDPLFDAAGALNLGGTGLFPSMPQDAYVCSTA
jgi:PKD repeat protein